MGRDKHIINFMLWRNEMSFEKWIWPQLRTYVSHAIPCGHVDDVYHSMILSAVNKSPVVLLSLKMGVVVETVRALCHQKVPVRRKCWMISGSSAEIIMKGKGSDSFWNKNRNSHLQLMEKYSNRSRIWNNLNESKDEFTLKVLPYKIKSFRK